MNDIVEVDDIVYSIRQLFVTEDEEDLCVVCYVNLPNITFYPCNHNNCCEGCYLQLEKKCPYCRSPINSTDREVDHVVPFQEVNFLDLDDEEWEQIYYEEARSQFDY